MGNFCAKCGCELKEGAKFCPSCGTPTSKAGDGEQVTKIKNAATSTKPKSRKRKPSTSSATPKVEKKRLGMWETVGLIAGGLLLLYGLIHYEANSSFLWTFNLVTSFILLYAIVAAFRGKIEKNGVGILAIVCLLWFPLMKGAEYVSNSTSHQETTSEIESTNDEQKDAVSDIQEEKGQKNPIAKFVGTYRFEYAENETAIIIVMEDGRCVKKVQGQSEYLGNVRPISDNAFQLFPKTDHFYLNVNLYNNGKYTGYANFYHWLPFDVVFDIKEGRLYQKRSEYDGRDIARAEYAKMTHESSTQSNTRKCRTCGKEYTPDDEAIVSNEYCYNDFPQKCSKCGKTYTINTDPSACLGTCGSCYSRHSAVKVYESVTGRQVN